jgi:DNA-directed RNA polymerase subunit RPC12/RpoP
MIRFHCPSGHLLTAAENQVGKQGKCPKCSAPIVVPTAEEADGAGSSGSAVTPAMGSGRNLPGGGELFVFLCPNGHKLNGPPSLKGKPGQCPHCGARFIIPTDEDIEAAAQEESEELDYGEQGDGQDPYGLGRIGSDLGAGETSAEAGGMRPPAGPAGLGFIVGQLWRKRAGDAELEIFLAEGEIIAPDHFSESLSTSDYGVFAVQESDGSYAVTVVPWATVRRVGLRRLGELPNELFP